MTQDEREDFFADEAVTFGAHADRDGSEQPKPYDDAIRSFVAQSKAVGALERKLTKAEATLARVEALADSWLRWPAGFTLDAHGAAYTLKHHAALEGGDDA